MARCDLTRTTKVRCRNRVYNFIAINHQFRLSVTIAKCLYLLPFFCNFLCSYSVFFSAIHIQKFGNSVSLSLSGTNFFFFQQYNILLIFSEYAKAFIQEILIAFYKHQKKQTEIRKFRHNCKRLSMGVNMITKMARGDQNAKCCT